MPAEYSADTEAILDRLKKEGSYIRNANKGNSLKNVNINLTKMQGVLNAINTNVLAQTSAFAASAANQAKVQQEAAEKSRRKEELAEVSDPRQAKLDDLKMKAALLRAQSDLKDAKGPGLIAKVKDKASMGFIAKMAAIGGTSFIAGSIIKGALDKIYDPEGDQGGVIGIVTKKLETLPNEISVKVEEGVGRALNDFKNDPKITGIIDGFTDFLKVTGALFGGGYFAAKVFKIGADTFKDLVMDKRNRAEKAAPKNTQYPKDLDEPAYKRKGQTPKSPVSMNPIDSPVTRANAAANAKPAKPDGVIKSTAKIVGKRAVQGVPFVGPALVTADLVQNALSDGSVQKLTDDAIMKFVQSGEFEKNQTTLTDVAIETGVSAGVGAALGAVAGPGALVTGTAGGVGGLISGFGRMGIEGYQDWGKIGRDSIPNAVEKAIKRQNKLYASEGLSPEGMEKRLSDAAANIEQAKGILGIQIQDIDDELSLLETELANLNAIKGGSARDRRTRANKKKGLRSKIKSLNASRSPLDTQLQNTNMIQQISNEEMRKFLESYGRKTELGKNSSSADVLDMISGSGGLEVAVTNVTNVNNYNSTTKGGDTNLMSTNVFADGGGGSREQTAMSPA
jgi:hypothetical protein